MIGTLGSSAVTTKVGSDSRALLDLLGGGDDPIDGLGLTATPTADVLISGPATNGKSGASALPSNGNNQDLLDLLGSLDMPASTPPAAGNSSIVAGTPVLGIGLDLNSLNDNSIKHGLVSSTTTTPSTLLTNSSSFGGLDNLLNSNLTLVTVPSTLPLSGLGSPVLTGLDGLASPTTPTVIGNVNSNSVSLFSDFSAAVINNNDENAKMLTALDKNGILVQLSAKNTAGSLQILMTATNNSLTIARTVSVSGCGAEKLLAADAFTIRINATTRWYDNARNACHQYGQGNTKDASSDIVPIYMMERPYMMIASLN